jgi:hypothetical protein
MTDPDDRKPRRESVVALRRCQKMVSLHVHCLLPTMLERSRDGGHERWPPFAHDPPLVCSTEPGAVEPVQRPSDAEAGCSVPSRSSPYCGSAAENDDDSRRTGCVQPSASYLTSVTSILDTANRKSTPWPTPVRSIITPLLFRMVVAAAPPPTAMPAAALTYFSSTSATFFK